MSIRRTFPLLDTRSISDWRTLAGLLLLCLVPRAVMAWRVPGICPDAVFYIGLGKSLEAGNFGQALQLIRFNTFPLILATLHRVGFGWETAGVVWGVAISSCTVLPLYGWVRRAFDRRIAWGAGFLYAVHPGLVRWSVEVIRDSTFWFVLALTLYLLHRAVSELRWRWFLAAGTAIALACMTRTEGLVLYVLLAAWIWQRRAGSTKHGARSSTVPVVTPRPLLRAPGSPLRAPRLLIGGMVCASVYPLFLLAVNSFWYRGPVTDLVRTQPAELARDWAHESVTGRLEATTAARPGLTPPLPAWRMAERFLSGLYKGLSPLYLLLIACGAVAMWSRWRQEALRRMDLRVRPTAGLVCTAGLILLAIWVHLYWSHEAGSRYFFSIVILTAPLASRGLMLVAAVLAGTTLARSVSEARNISPRLRFGLVSYDALAHVVRRAPNVRVLAILSMIIVVQMVLAFGGNFESRAAAMHLGQWVREHYGPAVRMLGPHGMTQVAAHYAEAPCEAYDENAGSAEVVAQTRRWQPAVLLLATDRATSPRDDAPRQLESQGFQLLAEDQLPPACQQMRVVVRSTTPLPKHETSHSPLVPLVSLAPRLGVKTH